MSKRLISKEVAQQRLSSLGRDFTIKEWNGTNKPCILVCNKCKNETTFPRGCAIYSKDSNFFRFRPCRACKVVYTVKEVRKTGNEELIAKWEKIARDKNIFIFEEIDS